jgi:hypothetical protein
MPKKTHPCIKTLIADIESKKIKDIRLTSSQVFDLYPAIKTTYAGDKNWPSFWCSLQKQYIKKGWLNGNQGEPPPEPAPDSLPPARRKSTPASTSTTPASDESPLDNKSPLNKESQSPTSLFNHSMSLMMQSDTHTQLENLPQTSKQSVYLQLSADK